MFDETYRNRRVLLTGHTGFKGSWLALWLKQMGAQVAGLALPPETNPNHWDLLKLDIRQYHTDIRNSDAVTDAVIETDPEIVFHFAAQSLVRRSYRLPLETWETNVMGTANLLEACCKLKNLRAIVVITTDKIYENKESATGYREEDPLGGHDPYSASKAATELAVASYRDAFFKTSPLVATARAGNVIGGGDWSEDRLIPDLARAQAEGMPLIIRAPNSIRPWQHVLEPLAGYLQLGQKLYEGKQEYQGAWNFGPDDDATLSVSDLLQRLQEKWPEVIWETEQSPSFHETNILRLDSSKARQHLQWKPVMTIDEQLDMTAEWYKNLLENGMIMTNSQFDLYLQCAKINNAAWAK